MTTKVDKQTQDRILETGSAEEIECLFKVRRKEGLQMICHFQVGPCIQDFTAHGNPEEA